MFHHQDVIHPQSFTYTVIPTFTYILSNLSIIAIANIFTSSSPHPGSCVSMLTAFVLNHLQCLL